MTSKNNQNVWRKIAIAIVLILTSIIILDYIIVVTEPDKQYKKLEAALKRYEIRETEEGIK